VLVFLTIGRASRPVMAAANAESKASAAAPVPVAGGEASMTVTVVPRSSSGVFSDTTLVYLDGRIDADAPDRLAKALDRVTGKVAIWLNSPGGNLFAGMQLGRVIRKHGASTHIIDYRTLLPGECYSACSLAFLGGVFRFNDNGARYGVHRASLQGGPTPGDRDRGPDLSGAIKDYIREMGVDARLFDLWVKAGPDEMYVLSQRQASELGVVNNGRKPPEWSIAAFPGGTLLQGQQTTAAGTGMVYFSCENKQTVFGSVYEGADSSEAVTARGWSHWLTIDGRDEIPLEALGVSSKDGFVRSTFILPPNLVRLAMSAKQIGHQMRPTNSRSPSITYRVDIDDRSVSMVRKFLGNCLRGRGGPSSSGIRHREPGHERFRVVREANAVHTVRGLELPIDDET
jgi:hypothetical protein